MMPGKWPEPSRSPPCCGITQLEGFKDESLPEVRGCAYGERLSVPNVLHAGIWGCTRSGARR